ncbi:MAG TPA: hypothetical protein VND65_11595 [Candidatus Binatia bacterium]|nr:hypothetical protein [Candidatus Binatia bacterium]
MSTTFSGSRALFTLLVVMAASSVSFAGKKLPPPPPAPAHAPTPAVNDDYIHKEFGDNCSLLGGPPQFAGDLDGDGVDDLVVAARCKNPMADQAEYGFMVADPYDSFLGFGNVKITSTFASDAPERKGVCLLVVHGVGAEGWRSTKPKQKFVLINLPFKTLAVKKLAMKKRTILGVYMEEQGEGEATSSVVFWDGRRYRYQVLGADLE